MATTIDNTPTTFKADDVVRFKDGNGNLLLWGDKVTIDTMFVLSQDGDRVSVSSYPYTLEFSADELVKVGEKYDTEYNDEGNEVYIWMPELNEDLDDPEDED